ncbi:MAG: NusG domain II-containing protein [Eubacteriales bacterium]
MLAALISAIVFWVQPFEGQLYASVYIDGEYIESIPLEQDINQVDLVTPYGENILIILNNKAYIKEADCGYEQCVNRGAISRPMQSIVCAPHGLVITIEDEKMIKDK